MSALIKLLEQQLGVSWSDVVEWMRENNSIALIEERLVTGRLDLVVQDVTAAAQKFAADVQHAYLESGRRASAWLDAKVPEKLVHFDSALSSVQARAEANTFAQVRGLTQESREILQRVHIEGSLSGEAPRETARRMRDSLGLTDPQERALANYRRSLVDGDWTRALSYETSSGNVDRTVRSLRQSGGSMTQVQIDRATDAWRKNGIAQRAEAIARTEALRVAHEGADDAMDQAIRRGDINADQLVKEWHAGPATRYSRPDHRAMSRHDPIPFLDDFVLPDGTRMSHPGDSRAGAEHVANCRCTVSVTFSSLD